MGWSNSSTAKENLHRSPSESNPDMEWDLEGGVEYAEFTATPANLSTENVNPAGFISKLKNHSRNELVTKHLRTMKR